MEFILLGALAAPVVAGWFKYRKQLETIQRSPQPQPTNQKRRLDGE